MKYELTIIYDEKDENKVCVGSNSHDSWLDLGILIEAVGNLMAINRKKKKMSVEEMADYVKKYIDKLKDDYSESFEIKAKGH